jgi:Ser/Thr protein kinase RdoA (MazF antagonist)
MVVVMSMMPGQRRSRGSLSRDEAANLGSMLGGLHQALRDLTPPDAARPTDAVPDAVAIRERWASLRQKALATGPATDFDRAVADVAAYAVDALARVPAADWSDQPYQLCHGDMHLDNVLFDDSGRVSGVLDFDNVAMGWVGFEVMMAWNLGLNADAGAPSLSPEAAAFFRQYRMTSGLSTRQIAGFPLLYWHRLVSNTWPASLKYKSECAPEPAWAEILSLRFRTARWLEENHAGMAEWLSDRG